MASVNFKGAGGTQYYDNTHTLPNCWHKTPTMSASGTLSGTRNGSTISGTIKASCVRKSGSYGYPVKIVLYQNGSEIARWDSPTGGNFTDYTINWSVTTNSAVTISVNYICGQPGGCTKTTYGLTNNSISFSAYNPSTPATNVQRGTIYSTNNSSYNQQTSRNISDKPDLKVWFDWWRTI